MAHCFTRIATPVCNKRSKIVWTGGTSKTGGITRRMNFTPFTAVSPLNMEKPAMPSTEQLFREWWSDSYPSAPPNSRTVETHVAFAEYVDQRRTQEVLDSIATAGDAAD